MKRIVLAYSGDLESSVAIPWLRERDGAEIVTLTLDIGQDGDLTGVRERALEAGALRAHVIDAREELVRDFITPALQAGVFRECRDPYAVELGRALVARRLVEVAAMESAFAVAHGSTGRTAGIATVLQSLIRSRSSPVTILSPAGEWGMSRTDALDYARARNVPIGGGDAACVNLWARSVGGHAFAEDPSRVAFALTRPPEDCPDEPASLEIELEAGLPVRVNGIEMPMAELIESVAIIGGAHGVGRSELVAAGDGARRILHEAPAACVLGAAYRELEAVVLPAGVNGTKRQSAERYATLLREGRWFSPERESIDAFVRSVRALVTGRVALRLVKGTCQVIAAVPRADPARQEVTS